MSTALELLKKHWHFSSFREPQESIINAVLDKKDVFVLLPTGAGKSLCYQLPALMSDGVCLVISPLIALMEDQVKNLEAKNIKALMLSSRLNHHETVIAFDNLLYGDYKFLYLSPEKLESAFIQEKIGQLQLNLIAIDEAHCISQWGHDFRPAYLKISALDELHPNIPKIALTATATEAVSKDIIENLSLRNCEIYKSSYIRDNLHIRIQKKENVRKHLLKLVRAVEKPVIIYVGTRKSTLEYQRFLMHNGIKATSYHGGMSHEQKSESLRLWKDELCKVMIATNAFGMGIDKSNVRMIIHVHLPGSLENFMQEIGRAGRDGKSAVSYLLYNDHIIYEANQMMQHSLVSPEFCKNVYTKLNEANLIAFGELTEKLYSFDLQEFALRYLFKQSEVYHALSHLQQEGIVYYDQNTSRSSKVRIIEKNALLFQLQSARNIQGMLLQLLLRSYGGIHDHLTNINETLLAAKLNENKQSVINALIQLNADKVIQYKKSSHAMSIRFLVPREDNFVFQSIKKDIVQRNKVKNDKFKAVIDLINRDQVCRQAQLLLYFGENLEIPCGKCDVCEQKSKQNPIDHQLIADRVISLLRDSDPLDLSEISTGLELEEKRLVKTLELLVEKRSIDLNLQNQFYIIE